MTRSRSALALLVCGVFLLGACSGKKSASQSDVRDDVHDQMVDPGYVAGPGEEPVPVEEAVANDIADCVSQGLFDPEQFTKDEREAAANSFDNDEPDPDLVVKVEDLVNSCYDDATTQGPSASDSSSDEETTTTEG